MSNNFIYLFFALFFFSTSPVFCGSDSNSDANFDDNDDGDDGGFDIFGIPILFPYADYHRGRKLIQLRPKVLPYAANPILMAMPKLDKEQIEQQDTLDEQNEQNEELIFTDKYNRRIFSLEPGSPDNPYLIQDHGTLNIGILGGISFADTQSYVVQYNALAKLFYTSGGCSERKASNYDEAKDLKQLKNPSKPKHFDSWNNGDDMRINGSMAIAIYAGVSIYIADARAGGILIGNWAKHITKLDENLVRIAFTREGGFGLTARIQALPLTKIEGRALKDWEGTLVFDFDRSTKEGRKALKNALNHRIFLKQDIDEDNVTLLTKRTSARKKISRNLQIGFPFVARARKSWHKVKMTQEVTNERNNKKTKTASKGYMKQKAYRHINLPKTNKHKKWKHFTYTNFHYNKISEGTAKISKNKITKIVKRSDIKLAMEVSFTHDRVKVKKVNDYNKIIAKKVGINDFVIDLGYKNKKQIGYVGLTYKLNIGTEALNNIINQAVENKNLFDNVSLYLINNYFAHKNDPHSICGGKLTNRQLCIALIKLKTKRKLDKIASDLRDLSKPKNIKSKSSSSTIIAKISRRLRTNQFVLQSFISLLPEKPSGYGTFEIEGEKFLGKKFIVDPNNQREIFSNMYDPEDDLLFDKIDAEMKDEDYDML
jgi:hypothetical protein